MAEDKPTDPLPHEQPQPAGKTCACGMPALGDWAYCSLACKHRQDARRQKACRDERGPRPCACGCGNVSTRKWYLPACWDRFRAATVDRSEYIQAWRAKKAESIREYTRRWQAEHPDRVRAYQATARARYQEQHKEELAEKARRREARRLAREEAEWARRLRAEERAIREEERARMAADPACREEALARERERRRQRQPQRQQLTEEQRERMREADRRRYWADPEKSRAKKRKQKAANPEEYAAKRREEGRRQREAAPEEYRMKKRAREAERDYLNVYWHLMKSPERPEERT